MSFTSQDTFNVWSRDISVGILARLDKEIISILRRNKIFLLQIVIYLSEAYPASDPKRAKDEVAGV
jgi:hypothetical protein